MNLLCAEKSIQISAINVLFIGSTIEYTKLHKIGWNRVIVHASEKSVHCSQLTDSVYAVRIPIKDFSDITTPLIRRHLFSLLNWRKASAFYNGRPEALLTLIPAASAEPVVPAVSPPIQKQFISADIVYLPSFLFELGNIHPIYPIYPPASGWLG